MFTKYGYTTIGVVAAIAFILVSVSFFTQSNPLKIILILAAAAILLLTLNFFRDPDRKTPAQKGIIVAPADGKIIVIKENISLFLTGLAEKSCSFHLVLHILVKRFAK